MRARLFAAFRGLGAGGFAALLVIAACAVGFGAAHVAQAAAAGASSDLLKVRLGGDATTTRMVLDLGRAASGKIVSDGSADGKVVISLSDVSLPNGVDGVGQGLVRRWSVDHGKLTIELAADAVVRRRFLLPPSDGVANYRYVVDLQAPAALPNARLTKVSTAPKVAVARPAPPRKRVIVIDAGHGGKDPGAHGVTSDEKDITLAAARALKARLEESGRYRVVMTRDSDVFVPLETRVKIARRADADLFISLHADAGPDESTRGLSVYTLSEKGQERATRVMNNDDWLMKASWPGGSKTVGQILMDLTQRATKNRSAQFAETLLEHVSDQTTLLPRSHRDAGYVVLLAPDVPAVLLEMGFVTSPLDEKQLTSAEGRERLMDAVGDSIDEYFVGQTKLASR
jgi:N-acetylmuramoyl-L-alanine amidase